MKFLSQPWLRRRRNRGLEDNLEVREEKDENSSTERSGVTEREEDEESGKVEKRAREREERQRRLRCPPDDDVCPICFGTFTVPFRGPCGHWYCGDCIIEYWNYGPILQPCKCPMCSQQITRLIPRASLDTSQHVKLLENVHKYNRLHAGGLYGLFLKVFVLPFVIKRIFCEIMDPDAHHNHLLKVRIFAMLLGAIYAFGPFDFLPIEHVDAVSFFDRLAIGLVLILYLVGLYGRRRRLRNAMQQLPLHNLRQIE